MTSDDSGSLSTGQPAGLRPEGQCWSTAVESSAQASQTCNHGDEMSDSHVGRAAGLSTELYDALIDMQCDAPFFAGCDETRPRSQSSIDDPCVPVDFNGADYLSFDLDFHPDDICDAFTGESLGDAFFDGLLEFEPELLEALDEVLNSSCADDKSCKSTDKFMSALDGMSSEMPLGHLYFQVIGRVGPHAC